MKTALLSIAALAILAGGGYALYHITSAAPQPAPQAQSAAVAQAASSTPSSGSRPVPDKCGQVEPTTDCVEYRNERYHFSLFYPETRDTKEYDEGGGASTIVFQNVKTVRGFQIFIVPYSLPQVTQQQFLKDEPSGVREGEQPITIDGVTGASFYSKDTMLGDVYEVWFIKDGYLYEITTLKDNADRLNERLTTWAFI